MSQHKIKLAKFYALPPGWAVAHVTYSDGNHSFLVRTIDGRRTEIEFVEGTANYTHTELSQMVYTAGDDDKPELRGYL